MAKKNKSMTAGEAAKLERKIEKEDQKYLDDIIKDMSPKMRKKYYGNVDKFPNAPLGRYLDGIPIKRNPSAEQMEYVQKARRQGHAVDARYPQVAKVIAHKRHILEDDPTLAKKSKKARGGRIKEYARGGGVRKTRG